VSEILNRLTATGLIQWDHEAPKDSIAASQEPGRRVSGTRMSTKRNLVSVRAPAPGLLERFERLTHYQLLGLHADCSPSDIERGHDLARALGVGTLAARMAARLGTRRVRDRVSAAYEVLRTPERKQSYNEYLLYREETRAIEDALSEGVRRASLVPPPARSSAPALRTSKRALMGDELSAP
ncbi:MAG: J domain-containing protein, partial [Polyangiales bacterium]